MSATAEAGTADTTAAPLLRVEERPGDVLAIILDRPDSSVNLIDEAWLREMTAVIDRVERDCVIVCIK